MSVKDDIEKNKKIILEEEPKKQVKKSYDFDKQNIEKAIKQKEENIKKYKHETNKKRRIKKGFNLFFMIISILIAILIIGLLFNINRKLNVQIDNINKNSVTQLNDSRPVLYSDTVKNIELDIYDIVYDENNITIEYKIINKSCDISPLFTQFSLTKEDKLLSGVTQYNNMDTNILLKNTYTEGFVKFNKNSEEDKISSGRYQLVLPFYATNDIYKFVIDFNL